MGTKDCNSVDIRRKDLHGPPSQAFQTWNDEVHERWERDVDTLVWAIKKGALPGLTSINFVDFCLLGRELDALVHAVHMGLLLNLTKLAFYRFHFNTMGEERHCIRRTENGHTNGWTDNGLSILCAAITDSTAPRLTQLWLSEGAFDDNRLLAAFLMPTLPVENGGSHALRRLECLSITCTGIGDEDVEDVFDVIAVKGVLPALTDLDLSCNGNMDSDSARALAVALEGGALPALKSVFVDTSIFEDSRLTRACRARHIELGGASFGL